jgi:hypothetical protein
MPDRIVRAGILTSDPVNLLSWPAEVFYRRLFSVVDDFGRYDGRPNLLRAHLYPLKIDKVSDADVTKWLTECVNAALVSVYRVAGRPYVEVLKFGQRVRAEVSKWPAPAAADVPLQTSAVICQQPRAGAAVFVSGDVFVSDPPKAPKGADGRFEEFWKAYPNKVGKDAAKRAFEKRKPDPALLAQMLAAIAAQKASPKWVKDDGQYIPNPATWLNQGRWQDGAEGDGAGEMNEWHETRAGVDGKAKALGLPVWDETEQWVFFKARVMQAAKEKAA